MEEWCEGLRARREPAVATKSIELLKSRTLALSNYGRLAGMVRIGCGREVELTKGFEPPTL